MYTQLRNNIISTVYNSWQSTGSAWEQYNPSTGAGQRTQGFTGWTALVVNILAMPDLTYAVPQEAPKPFKFGDLLDNIMGGIFAIGFFFLIFFLFFGIPICMAYYERNKRRLPPGYTGLVHVRRVNTNYLPLRLLRMGQAARNIW
jgi:preprotein translocase subunit SecY